MDKSWEERISASAGSLFEDLVEMAKEHVERLNAKYESPIEEAFAVAANVLLQVRYPEFLFYPGFGKSIGDIDSIIFPTDVDRKSWGVVAPQVPIENYRADFVLRYAFGLEGCAGVVIECDGHDFHEKTKDQAARDKARDRAMQMDGYHVFRFTGSEIWADPIGCAEQVLCFAHARALESAAARHYREIGHFDEMHRRLKWMNQ